MKKRNILLLKSAFLLAALVPISSLVTSPASANSPGGCGSYAVSTQVRLGDCEFGDGYFRMWSLGVSPNWPYSGWAVGAFSVVGGGSYTAVSGNSWLLEGQDQYQCHTPNWTFVGFTTFDCPGFEG
jgi:hypothetical protein